MTELKALDKIIDELTRAKNKLLANTLDEYSLGNGQYNILFEISVEEGISQQVIADRRNVDKSSAAKSIKRLIENGYVYKERDMLDKRAYCLYCTDKGRNIIPTIQDIVANVDEILIQNSTADEIQIFRNVCERMSENINSLF